MKKSPDEIKEIIKKYKEGLKEKYNVSEIGIFGSFVSGEAKEESDMIFCHPSRKLKNLLFRTSFMLGT